MDDEHELRLSRQPPRHIRGVRGTTAIQSVLVPTSWNWDANETGEYIIRQYGVVPLKVHRTQSFQRFRIVDPNEFTHFFTRKERDGVRLVMGFY